MGAYIQISIDEVQEPKAGMIVIKDHWWLVDNCKVLGYKPFGLKSKDRPTPQCNKQKAIKEMAKKEDRTLSAMIAVLLRDALNKTLTIKRV